MRSSRFATCASSHCARRAIAVVSRWSHNFHPSRSARSLAITAAPLPNSRSIVMIFTLSIFLSCGAHLALAGLVLFQKEGENEHDRGSNAEKPEGIDVGQHCGLTLRGRVEPGVRLRPGLIEARSGLRQLVGQAVYSVE